MTTTPTELKALIETAAITGAVTCDVEGQPKLGTKVSAAIRSLKLPETAPAGDAADMEELGRSTMAAIAVITSQEGPYKDWTPAEDPAEIITDLYEDLLQANETIASLRAAPQWRTDMKELRKFVLDHWDNQDMNHADFRVHAYQIAAASGSVQGGE